MNKSLSYKGEGNPNNIYSFDRRFFKNIDTEEKAYILGFIASDGSIGKGNISIYVNKRDIGIIENIRNIICESLKISKKEKDLVGINISSMEIVNDICRHLKINYGKKSDKLSMPNIDDKMKIHFIRGFFDGDGHIRTTDGRDFPECGITSNSTDLLNDIIKFIGIETKLKNNRIEYYNVNALDFLSKIYDNASIYMNRKFYLYLDWSMYSPIIKGKNIRKKFIEFKVAKTHENAIIPFKNRASDCGYDLTFIRKIKEDGDIHWFGTGIKISPAYGFYVDIVPRSSISKWGYMLSNSIGIIDRGYSGEIIAPMIKINKDKPEPELPIRMLQAIPRQVVHVKFEIVDNLDETERSYKGFGSTGET